MFAWGSTIHGELGLGGIEEEHIVTPTELQWSEARNVVRAALGDNHTLFLTGDGKVYSCGNNDYGQLGHSQPRKRPQLVSGLEAHPIVSVACGAMHSLALNQWGQLFSWGSDIFGQLGHQMGAELQIVPKVIKLLATQHVVQVVSGQRHSMALTNAGDIYVWGANNFGQLGLGNTTPYESSPAILVSLQGVPMSFIACGANHSFAVSKSGAAFGWGKNTNGQLGLNDTSNKIFPTQLRTLRNIKVRFVSCGEEFSCFLTVDGGVFTCGSGMYGQLGHGVQGSEILPRQVIELMGSTITQVACGRQHTLAFVPSRGRVYSFGLGGAGQLGLRKPTNATTPQVVLGPWVSPSGTCVLPNSTSALLVTVKRIFAGGDHCFVSVVNHSVAMAPCDFRVFEKGSQILELKGSRLEPCLKIKQNGRVDQDVLSYLETVFKSLACLNGSFLEDNDEHYCCTSKHNGLNMNRAQHTFDVISKLENASIKELIWNCIVDDVLPKLSSSPPDVESLRIYLILPLYHEFHNPKRHLKLHKPFVNALLRLKPQASKVVGMWWCGQSRDYFEKLIVIFKAVINFILRNQKIPEGKTVFYDPSLVAMLDALNYLNKLNHSVDGLKVSYDTFYITDLNEYLDVRIDYVMWLTDQNTGRLFLCNYPFIFDPVAKTKLLETDQSIQMQNAMQTAAQQALFSMLTTHTLHNITQYLVINVSRENIVSDALRELSSVDANDLKKPIKVKFCGEEAEDAGGVRKEFFMLLLREILDPKYGMFKEYPETRAVWFSESFFEDEAVYFLIGIICGLAIYNFTIIDLPFPLALYKKLLNENVTLVDLKGLSPTMANSLQSLLDYKGGDMQDVFCLAFEINREVFGESTVVQLKPNGSNIPVTQDNKEEYVKLYVDYIFNTSIKQQYDAFHAGFMKVCGGRVLKLFQADELMAVVVGNENYDWHALEEAAEYKNGYKSSDQTIRWFWKVIHDMSLGDKKKFLLFLTGSDRIPIQGMKAIKIIIQPTNDDKYLPVAHTCFNLLDLPRYKTKEKLRYKLMQAIQQNQGFSLV